jgi:formylglycine-generating enzyme required for sulfatase activity
VSSIVGDLDAAIAAAEGGADARPDALPACPNGMIDTGGGFCIDAMEVTQASYAAFLATAPAPLAGACSGNATYVPTAVFIGQHCRYDPVANATEPIVCIDWCDAKAYCAWAGKRLCGKRGGGAVPEDKQIDPAIDEWYFACSLGGARVYPYGLTFTSGACHAPGAPSTPVAVGSKPACVGGLPGLHDMSGNVLEWEDSCSGNTDGNDRCRIRGGSWFFPSATDLRCDAIPNAPNDGYHPKRSDAFDDTGFRCCKTM